MYSHYVTNAIVFESVLSNPRSTLQQGVGGLEIFKLPSLEQTLANSWVKRSVYLPSVGIVLPRRIRCTGVMRKGVLYRNWPCVYHTQSNVDKTIEHASKGTTEDMQGQIEEATTIISHLTRSPCCFSNPLAWASMHFLSDCTTSCQGSYGKHEPAHIPLISAGTEPLVTELVTQTTGFVDSAPQRYEPAARGCSSVDLTN